MFRPSRLPLPHLCTVGTLPLRITNSRRFYSFSPYSFILYSFFFFFVFFFFWPNVLRGGGFEKHEAEWVVRAPLGRRDFCPVSFNFPRSVSAPRPFTQLRAESVSSSAQLFPFCQQRIFLNLSCTIQQVRLLLHHRKQQKLHLFFISDYY